MLRLEFILFLSFLLSCGPGRAQHVHSSEYDAMLRLLLDMSVPTVDVADLDIADGALLLDAREKDEFNVAHLPNARWVGFNDFDLSRVKDVPKDAPIIVYCSVGYRSEKVSEKLRNAGYSHVKNLYGGIFEWVNSGKAVVDENGPTTKVHGYNTVWSVWLTKGEIVY
jgi:rhodanese-related sulfurtransferase